MLAASTQMPCGVTVKYPEVSVDVIDRLRAGLLTGEWIDLTSRRSLSEAGQAAEGPGLASVDGWLLRQLLTEPLEGAIRRRALRLRGAVISGDLDWSWQVLDCPTEFADCAFEASWSLANAHLRALTLTHCVLASMQGSQLVVDGGVVVDSSKVRGTIWLPDASITGSVHFAALDVAGTDDWFGRRAAIVAPRMKVAGALRVDEGSRIDGLTSLRGVQLGGGFLAVNCRFDAGDDTALDLTGAQVSGDVTLSRGFRARGTVELRRSVIAGAVACEEGLFRCPQGEALSLDGAQVGSGVFLRDGFRAVGPDLPYQETPSRLTCDVGDVTV
jgi:hypothetical protein